MTDENVLSRKRNLRVLIDKKRKTSPYPNLQLVPLVEDSVRQPAPTVIHFQGYIHLKDKVHPENFKMRNGLVLKVHEARKKSEAAIANKFGEDSSKTLCLAANLLAMASACCDEILYDDSLSTLELLNKYWQFKDNLDLHVERHLVSSAVIS